MSVSPRDDDADDIFRDPGPPSPPRSPSPASSKSSASSHLNPIGRAIAALVEHAIAHWAGGSDSSSSSSRSSSDSHSRRTKDDLTSRIGRLQAREEERRIPRQFSFTAGERGRPIFKTTDLGSVLNVLDASLRSKTRCRAPLSERLDYMIPQQTIGAPSRAASFTDVAALADRKKGKGREGQLPPVERTASRAWFLDVSSPTWEDMRALGKLLHLHPLTLEDILLDPREKLEHFHRLGYYFLSFRAINSWDDKEKEQAAVAESNVYLVVFREGVVCFNFTDVSEHTDRVRNRLARLDTTVNMSPEWIAHGILDSIVDSFFPFLKMLEDEVMAIENIVFSPSGFSVSPIEPEPEPEPEESEQSQKEGSTIRLVQLNEKTLKIHLHPRRSFFWRRLSLPLLRRWKRSPSTHISANATTLHRMARARRLVTTLSRLLSSKSDVIAQLRKRLLTSKEQSGESSEIVIYLGDVQDHIVTLETSLAHYERMLSQSHPLYISQMRTIVSVTKGGTDKALLYLTSVSIGVLCIQTLQGVFSINVTVPSNAEGGTRYNVFGIVLALDILVLFSFLQLLYYWWRKAKRRPPASL